MERTAEQILTAINSIGQQLQIARDSLPAARVAATTTADKVRTQMDATIQNVKGDVLADLDALLAESPDNSHLKAMRDRALLLFPDIEAISAKADAMTKALQAIDT